MKCTITHEGVPLGSLELTSGELVIADIIPSASYEALRPTIVAASASLHGMGFLHPEGVQSRVSVESLGRAAALPFELRDANGLLVPTDWINVIDWPTVGHDPVAMIKLRHAHAGVAAALPTAPRVNQSGNKT